jgi:phage-related protein
MSLSLKPVEWVGSSLDDLREFPEEVQQVMGYALYLAQCGEKHNCVKPLKGFKGAGVLEVVEDFDGDTYRAVYTVKLESAVYVLHAFQKKSKHGIATTKQDIELIKARFKRVKEHYAHNYSAKQKDEKND